jgi:hypothetical protein
MPEKTIMSPWKWWLLSPVEDFAQLVLGLKDADVADGVRVLDIDTAHPCVRSF